MLKPSQSHSSPLTSLKHSPSSIYKLFSYRCGVWYAKFIPRYFDFLFSLIFSLSTPLLFSRIKSRASHILLLNLLTKQVCIFYSIIFLSLLFCWDSLMYFKLASKFYVAKKDLEFLVLCLSGLWGYATMTGLFMLGIQPSSLYMEGNHCTNLATSLASFFY